MTYYRPSSCQTYPITIAHAEGAFLYDKQGRAYLDLLGANGAISCGHGNPAVVAAVREQLDRVWLTADLPTTIQETTIAEIDRILPDTLNLGMLYSTGSEAVELALRLARAMTGGRRFITFKEHFHGKTHGLLHLLSWYPDCYGPAPAGYRTNIDLGALGDANVLQQHLLETLRSQDGPDLAGVVCEPVLGASGPQRLPDALLPTLQDFCRERGVPLIVDEILSGLFRCDGWFVSQSCGVCPDILCFGKGLANGLPISAVAVSPAVAEYLPQTMAGSTFSGNSLVCAAACGVLGFLHQHDLSPAVARLERLFYERLRAWAQRRGIALKLDGVGALLSLGFPESDEPAPDRLYHDLLERAVIVSRGARRLRLMPALTISASDFEQGLETIAACLDFQLDHTSVCS